MTAIMGFLIGLIMVFFGNGYLTMVTGLVGGLLADVILKRQTTKVQRVQFFPAVCSASGCLATLLPFS